MSVCWRNKEKQSNVLPADKPADDLTTFRLNKSTVCLNCDLNSSCTAMEETALPEMIAQKPNDSEILLSCVDQAVQRFFSGVGQHLNDSVCSPTK